MIDHKVDFVLLCLVRAVLSTLNHHHAYIDRVSASDQLTVDDVFHQVCRFCLAEIDARISEAWICGIVFDWIVEIMPSFDVISRGFVKQKCVFEISKIFDNGRPCRFCVYG